MLKRFLGGLAGAFILALALSPVVLAVAHTVNFTAGQDTQIQTRLIPIYNADHCQQFGLAGNCNTSQLTAPGRCTVKTVKTLVIDSCVIFTQDSTGEDAFLQEQLNQHLLLVFLRNDAANAAALGTALQNASGANQTTACGALAATLPPGVQCP